MKKHEQIEYLDRKTKESLLTECDRLAKRYDNYGFQKQAKKIRVFKKQLRQLVGSL